MPPAKVPPRRLYKFRTFAATTLEMLVDDKVFYADPSTFNDPLDTQPTLEPDLSVPELEQVLQELISNRMSQELSGAARQIRSKGPKTLDRIEQMSRLTAERATMDIAYMATDPEYDEPPEVSQKRLLARSIERELLRRYTAGILSLGSRYTCPLMWSHYGDQHRGICLGYSIPEAAKSQLRCVQYGGSRLVHASQVRAMLAGNLEAKRRVDEGVLLHKARDWRYEKEWRHIGARGLSDSPFELEEVIFGARCTAPVKHAILKSLDGRERAVKFFQMHDVSGNFRLRRRQLDEEDVMSMPRRALTVLEEFSAIT